MPALFDRLQDRLQELQTAPAVKVMVHPAERDNPRWDAILSERVQVCTLWEWLQAWARTRLQKAGMRLMTPEEQQMLVAHLWEEVAPAWSEKARAMLGGGPGLVNSLTATLQELRLHGVTSENLSPETLHHPDRGKILLELLTGYEQYCEAGQLADPARVAHLALEEVLEGKIQEHVIFYSPLSGPTTLLSVIDHLDEESITRLYSRPKEKLTLPDNYTDVARLRFLAEPSMAPPAKRDGSLTMFRALSPEYEVRAVLGTLLKQGIPLDQAEVLYTQEDIYPALFQQIVSSTRPGGEASSQELLVYRGGYPLGETRPGMAFYFWIEWLRSGAAKRALLECLARGLIRLPAGVDSLTAYRLAADLPDSGSMEAWNRYCAEPPEIPASSPEEQQARKSLLECIHPFTERWQRAADSRQVLEAGLCWLHDTVTVQNERDQRAAARLEHYLATWTERPVTDKSEFLDQLLAWLESTRLAPERPEPGKLVLTPLNQGACLNKPWTFLVGLSDDWYPVLPVRPSLLTDRERKQVSPELEGQTMRSLLQQQEAAVLTLLEQQTGNLVVTYPCADQLDDRERFPSQLFLRIFRLTAELPEGDLQDCESWLPAPLGPDTAWCRLTDTENWLNQWPEQPYKDALFKKDFLWLCRGAYALKERASFRFTEHDGLVPEAGHLFGPKSSRVHSANSLQTYGKCPQQFYLQHVLQLSLPEEEALEPGRWLHPLVRGQLLHTVFHRYHLELKQKKRKPDLVQDRALLHRLLQEELQKLEPTLPVVATPTRQLEMQELLETMNLFLGEEVLWAERYQPRYFEVNLGGKPEELPSELDDSAPQEIALPSGRTILLQGRIDRIDLVLGGDGRTYFIWDYKTGKMNEFLQAQAHARGQHLQPLLYLEMVEQRLQQVHGPKARVEGAGYFFPGQKGGQGDRLVWQAADLRKHKSLIDTLIDLQQAGVFLATDRKETCEHCPFRDACDVPEVNRQAVNKLKKPELPVLHALRSLRKAKE